MHIQPSSGNRAREYKIEFHAQRMGMKYEIFINTKMQVGGGELQNIIC